MRWTFLNLAPSNPWKMVLPFRHIGLMAAVALGLLALAAAQEIPGLVELSPEVATAHADLAGQRAALAQERQALHARFDQHNQRCTNIDPENKVKISDCASEHAELAAALKAHIARSESFNAAAQAATAGLGYPKPQRTTQTVTKHLEYRGDFSVITPDGQRLVGGPDLPLTMGSRIVTGPNTRLDLTLLDDTRFIIGPNSDIVVDEYLYDPSSGLARITASVVAGVFRWVRARTYDHKLPWERKIQVTPAVIGVRGTDLEVSFVPNGPGYIKLFEGQLEITETKTGDVFLMDAHQMVTLNTDGTVGRPIPLKQGERPRK